MDGGDDDRFIKNRERFAFDDAAILAMCEPDIPNFSIENSNVLKIPSENQQLRNNNNDEGVLSPALIRPTIDQPGISFGMEGSTININNSKDIHFGPRTMTSQSEQRDQYIKEDSPGLRTSPMRTLSRNEGYSNFASSNLPLMEQNQNIYTPSVISSNPESTTAPPFKIQMGILPNPGQHHAQPGEQSSYCSNTVYQNETFGYSPAPSVNSHGSNTQPITIRRNPSTASEHKFYLDNINNEYEFHLVPRNSSRPESLNLSSLNLNPNMNNENVAIKRASFCSSPTNSSIFQCLPSQDNQPLSNQAPMSAAISNSSNVQMGTQIVYNYYISESEPRNLSHSHSGNFSESAVSPKMIIHTPTEKYLGEFKEKLSNVYRKRTQSSPLPWHRGKQLIPMDEYYTEPQIVAIDKFGNRTTETVNLMSMIITGSESRFLIEGEAGMGKTFLATKLAEDWAQGTLLQQYQVLLLVTLADFKGSLQEYVKEELLPSYFKPEQFDKAWEYCKTHEKEIIFVLDGYDELKNVDGSEVHDLIRSKDFPDSKVIVTSRPNFLKDWEKKIVVSGFDQFKIVEFITKYFKAIGNTEAGEQFRKVIETNDQYWKLARRPLFCVLLCMLYVTGDVDASLPARQSDIMLQIILCLIKWNKKNNGNPTLSIENIPPEYEKPFQNFGKECLNALRRDKNRFTQKEVSQIDGFDSKLEQLGFLYSDDESHALGQKRFWKPVHQTFIEYLAAFYMSKHIKDCKSCKDCKDYSLLFQKTPEILKFCVGIMKMKAYKLLDGNRFPFLWKLPAKNILQLLKEAEPTSENCQAIAKLMDQSIIEITTSEIELEGWSSVINRSFKNLNTLKIVWRIKSRSPDQEVSFVEASDENYLCFFEALKNNINIKCIHVRAKQDGETFTEENIVMFFKYFEMTLQMKNLQELHIVEMKINASAQIKTAFENYKNLNVKKRMYQLKLLKIHTLMHDQDLQEICEALKVCTPNLETLQLEGLENGNRGFQSLVDLLKNNSSIKNLHLSMNQSFFVNVFESEKENNFDYSPKNSDKTETHSQKSFDNKILGYSKLTSCSHNNDLKKSDKNNSLTDFEKLQKLTTQSTNVNKKSEHENRVIEKFSYILEKIDFNANEWNIGFKSFWFLQKNSSELRIPLPICIEREHKSVFHIFFSQLPETHLKNLMLTQAGLYLTMLDLVCLGQAITKAKNLISLNLQSLERADKYLPLLIGIGDSEYLNSINFSSSKVVINDDSFQVISAAIQNNKSLRKASFCRWQFSLKERTETIENFRKMLKNLNLSSLDLSQCSIVLYNTDQNQINKISSIKQFKEEFSQNISNNSKNNKAQEYELSSNKLSEVNYSKSQQPSPKHILQGENIDKVFLENEDECNSSYTNSKNFDISDDLAGFFLSKTGLFKSLKTLSLEGFQFLDSCERLYSGHQLIKRAATFMNLSSLDVSTSVKKTIDEVSLQNIFSIIASRLKLLMELKLDGWELHLRESQLPDFNIVLGHCKKLKKISLERVNEIISRINCKTDECDSNFNCKSLLVHYLISYLPHLEEVSLCYYGTNSLPLGPVTGHMLGKCLNDHWSHTPYTVRFFKLAPEVESLIYNSLKKHPCRGVKIVSSSPLIRTFEVRNVLNIIRRH